jgi:hypothetical protein
MFDTVALRHAEKLPSPSELLALGWRSSCGHFAVRDDRQKWFLNLPDRPRLTWSTAPDGGAYLTAECSLPKLLYGNNVVMVSDAHLPAAFDSISEYVSKSSDRDFDSRTSLVGRLDICHNFQVGEPNVNSYISGVSGGSIPRMIRNAISDSTVRFQGKQSKVMVYGKFSEVSHLQKQGKATPEEVAAARGVLRLEASYFKTPAIKRLTERYGFAERIACNLLSGELAKGELEKSMSKLSLDKPIVTQDARIEALIRSSHTGTRLEHLMGFLSLLDRFGEDFYLLPELNYKRATYYKRLKACRDAGVLRSGLSHKALPALELVWDADVKERAA